MRDRSPASVPFRMILATGGAAFIGSNFVLDGLARSDEPVVNPDTLSPLAHAASALP